MAITYPRVLAQSGMAFQSVNPMIMRSTIFTALRSGAAQRVEVAPERWRIDYVTVQPKQINEHDAWAAFLDTLQGGLKIVRAGDPTRAFPMQHPDGTGLGGTWNGIAPLDSRNASTLIVDVNRPALTMSIGDMVAVAAGGGIRRLFRVTEPAQTNAGTGLINLSVEPKVNMSLIAPGADVLFFNPVANFVLDPESVQTGKAARENPPISFSLIQDLG